MDRVVEKAADPRRADSGCLRLQIKYLADHPRLPEKPAVEPRSVPPQARFEFRDHPQGKCAVSGDILIAADLGGQFSRIAFLEQEKRNVLRTAGRRDPGILLVRRPAEGVQFRGVTDE